MKRINAVSILVAACLMVLAACEEEDIEERLPKEMPKIALEKFNLTETRSGQKLWTLSADRANVYEEIIKADQVTVRFYDDNEDESSVLNALRGELNTRTHNIFVADSVVIITNDSTKLYTDSLFWLNDSGRILTDAHVVIRKGDGTVIEGNGLRTDPRLTRIEIVGETRGVSPVVLPDIRK